MTESDENRTEEVEEFDENEEQTVQQLNNKETKFQNDLANELQNNLKIPITDEPPNIGSTPYKVAIVGMNELGSATAFLLICRQVVTDIIIIDQNSKRLAGTNINKSSLKIIFSLSF